MIKKYFILTVVIYFLILAQTSFFLHFPILKLMPNIAFIFVIIFNLAENQKEYVGIYLALSGGLFLDIFSNNFIGLNMLIMLFISLFIKFVFKRYVRIPFIEKT